MLFNLQKVGKKRSCKVHIYKNQGEMILIPLFGLCTKYQQALALILTRDLVEKTHNNIVLSNSIYFKRVQLP